MHHNEAGGLAELVIRRMKWNELCRRRLCRMTREERIEERNCKQMRKRILHGFILEEADESDNDKSVQSEEDGFRDAYANLLPLDSIEQPYIEFILKKRRLLQEYEMSSGI